MQAIWVEIGVWVDAIRLVCLIGYDEYIMSLNEKRNRKSELDMLIDSL